MLVEPIPIPEPSKSRSVSTIVAIPTVKSPIVISPVETLNWDPST